MIKGIILIKRFLPAILIGFGLLAFILLVKPNIPLLLTIIFALSFGVNVYLSQPVDQVLINSAKNTILAAILIFLFKWIGAKGVIFSIIGIVAIGLFIIIRRWKLFIKTLGDIEQEFFGRRFR